MLGFDLGIKTCCWFLIQICRFESASATSVPLHFKILNFYLTREAAVSIARRVYTVASCLRYSAEA